MWLFWQQAQWVLQLVLPGWLQLVRLGWLQLVRTGWLLLQLPYWPLLWRNLCLALPWPVLVGPPLGSWALLLSKTQQQGDPPYRLHYFSGLATSVSALSPRGWRALCDASAVCLCRGDRREARGTLVCRA